MRVVFFGIYEYGLLALEKLVASDHDVAAVVSKPETPGNAQPVAHFGRANGIETLQPDSAADPLLATKLKTLNPDLIAVAGYHQRVPPSILDTPRIGTINAHAALLPAYRGPCAHKWVLINGESHTGVTIHIMTPRFDDGDILLQRRVAILEEDTGETLLHRLAPVAASLLLEAIDAIEHGNVQRRAQAAEAATYHSYPTERDALIDWSNSARSIRDLVRGVSPRPGAWTVVSGQRIRVRKCRILPVKSGLPDGTIESVFGDVIRVSTGTADIAIEEWVPDDQSDSDQCPPVAQRVLKPGARFTTRD